MILPIFSIVAILLEWISRLFKAPAMQPLLMVLLDLLVLRIIWYWLMTRWIRPIWRHLLQDYTGLYSIKSSTWLNAALFALLVTASMTLTAVHTRSLVMHLLPGFALRTYLFYHAALNGVVSFLLDLATVAWPTLILALYFSVPKRIFTWLTDRFLDWRHTHQRAFPVQWKRFTDEKRYRADSNESLVDMIYWPVISGKYHRLSYWNIYLSLAVLGPEQDQDINSFIKIFNAERLRWHPDRLIPRIARANGVTLTAPGTAVDASSLSTREKEMQHVTMAINQLFAFYDSLYKLTQEEENEWMRAFEMYKWVNKRWEFPEFPPTAEPSTSERPLTPAPPPTSERTRTAAAPSTSEQPRTAAAPNLGRPTQGARSRRPSVSGRFRDHPTTQYTAPSSSRSPTAARHRKVTQSESPTAARETASSPPVPNVTGFPLQQESTLSDEEEDNTTICGHMSRDIYRTSRCWTDCKHACCGRCRG